MIEISFFTCITFHNIFVRHRSDEVSGQYAVILRLI